MKLYANPLSPNCRKVHAVVAHLGASVEQVPVDLLAGGSHEPAFLAINPNGKVPALVDGDEVLWESNAIMGYIASKQDTSLWPKSNARYQILKWLNWEACHFGPAVGKLIGQYIFAPMRGATPDEAIIADALKDFRKYAAVANAQLETTKFLVGDDVTLADFSVGVLLGYEQVCKLPLGEFGHLSRWWGDLQAVPGGRELLVPQR